MVLNGNKEGPRVNVEWSRREIPELAREEGVTVGGGAAGSSAWPASSDLREDA
jgi:hypothetical protein